MGFKELLRKQLERYAESKKPENVEKRLQEEIKQAQLRDKLESVQAKRIKRKEKLKPKESKGEGIDIM